MKRDRYNIQKRRITLRDLEYIGELPDSIRIVRYRWHAGNGRNSRRYRRCTVIEINAPKFIGATDNGDLIDMEIERPSMQHLAGYVKV